MDYSKVELTKMYEQMVLGRKYVEKMSELIGKGKLAGFFHLGYGQEAIGAGIMNAMGPNDYLLPTHRQQVVLVNKLEINKFTAELTGKVTGYCRGKGFEFHVSSPEEKVLPIAAVLGSGGPMAVGAAMALKLDRKDGVVICCCGDGASSEGNNHESMNIATVFKLPMVFVIENNGWAISQPASKQCAVGDFSARAAGYGMVGVSVDGTDVIIVRETIEQAIKKAREGQPSVVELRVSRWRPHFEGDPQRYRDLKEVEEAKKDDCILKLEAMLLKKNILTAEDVKKINTAMFKKVEDAFAYADSCSLPNEEQTLDLTQVYAGEIGGLQ